ncbi:hypothetical protein PT2222_20373 [Paraburkholderia tropica]
MQFHADETIVSATAAVGLTQINRPPNPNHMAATAAPGMRRSGHFACSLARACSLAPDVAARSDRPMRRVAHTAVFPYSTARERTMIHGIRQPAANSCL